MEYDATESLTTIVLHVLFHPYRFNYTACISVSIRDEAQSARGSSLVQLDRASSSTSNSSRCPNLTGRIKERVAQKQAYS